MNSWFSQNKKPLIQSLGVFLLMFGAVILITIYYDFSQIDVGALLFLTAFLCCVFVAKNTFDMSQASDMSEELKKSVASDLAISSEELYVQLYKNSPVPYLIIDFEGHVKSANIAAARLLGEKQISVTGINIFSRLKCDELEHLDLLVEKYRKGLAVSDEMVRVGKVGSLESWALLSLYGFTDAAGEKIGLLTLVDITKQKKAEDAKSEFVSLASHQLRTPIAGMKWSAELLLMDNPNSLNARQHKYIDRLLISIQRMAMLVDDFLRVSRFELGTFQAEYKKVNLVELFEDVIDEQSTRVKQKKITIKTFFDESLSKIESDPNLIRMIVTNLYTNATKYTREEGTIHLGFARKEDNIVITVADNGIGIPIEDHDDIFAKLFRASNAVRNVPDGTGLGLYILKEAVTVLRGRVTFTSTENIGTTFEVTLPLEDPDLKTKD
ncbi:PAS domain-containing sensor histidine kinase [Candidatus Nomurabacteria bacterium]|nr:PAS domain S-box protein [Candidatus Kaiserbacteria bacterium]MCB9815723.1 PAS domain-containing sensor histidine kinase [Candidatus Nomurabacteria bacterium]